MKNSVEIEFLMRDKLSDGLEATSKKTEHLADAATAASAEVAASIKATKELASEAEQKIAHLTEQLSKMGNGDARTKLKAEIDALTESLKQSLQATEGVEREHTETAKTTENLVMKLRAMQQEMVRMAQAGLAGTAEYKALAEQAGALSDAIGDVRQQVRHLADDNARLTAFADGVNGLAGAFTAGTGIVSLFAGENEDLIKIQTKLQSVIAITMGLQQVYNTLNKDSAFRVVAVGKAKQFLTAANYRLATALGISTAAATALMAALTLGLSVAITAVIVAFERFSSAQEEAAKKTKERLELEHDARLAAEKARIELDQHINSLKTFVGTKEEEKKKIKELNDKYGESFGYHQTTKEWLDILIERGQAYARVLFLQAKMQTLANKAAEAQVQADELKQSPSESAKTALGFWGKAVVGGIGFLRGLPKGSPLVQAKQTIDESNLRRQTAAIRDAQTEVETLQSQMQSTIEEMNQINKAFSFGGHTSKGAGGGKGHPSKLDVKSLSEEYVKAYQSVQDKLRENDAQLIEDNYVRQRVVAKQALERELADIEADGQQRIALLLKVRKAQQRAASPEEVADIESQTARLKTQATQLYQRVVSDLQKEQTESMAQEKQAQQAHLNELLSKYQDYNARRLQLTEEHEKDIRQLQAGRTEQNAPKVDGAIAWAKQNYQKSLAALNNEELEAARKTAPLLIDLFADASTKSRSELRKIQSDTIQLLDYLHNTASADLTDKFGLSAEQLRRMQQSPEQLKAMADALLKIKEAGEQSTHPIERLFRSFRKLAKAGSDPKATTAASKEVLRNFTEVSGSLAQGARQLSSVYRELNSSLADTLDTMADTLEGAKNIAQGFLSGGWTGAAMAAVGELINVFNSHAATRIAILKEERRQVQETIAVERAYQSALFDTALAFEQSKNLGIDAYGKMSGAAQLAVEKQRELNEALKGKEAYHSFAQETAARLPEVFQKTRKYYEALHAEEARRFAGKEALANIRIKLGSHKEASGFLGWGSKVVDDYGSILLKYPKLIDEAGRLNRKYAEAVLNEAQFRDDVAKQQLQHFITLAKEQEEAFAAVDSYLESIFGGTGAALSDALVNAFRNGANAAEEFGRSVDKMLEKFATDMAYSLVFADDIATASQRIQEIGRSTLSQQEKIAQTTAIYGQLLQQMGNKEGMFNGILEQAQKEGEKYGRKLFEREGQNQQAQSGAFTAMTQEQGTKLEGLFTAGQMHWASIDRQLQGMTHDVSQINSHLASIKEDTMHLRLLRPLLDTLERIGRDGLKMK